MNNKVQTNRKDARFDFLSIAHRRLMRHFPSNGAPVKIAHKLYFQYMSQVFRFDRDTSRSLMFALKERGLLDVEKSSGNGNYVLVLRCAK